MTFGVVLGAGSAHAGDEQRHKEGIAALDEAVKAKNIKPGPGVDTAAAQAPGWCNSSMQKVESQAIARIIANEWKYGSDVLNAATYTCSVPKDPVVHKAVALILQDWMNGTGLSAAEAQEVIKYRLDDDKFKADQTALCKSFELSDEVGGAEKQFNEVRQELFGGCNGNPLIWESTVRHHEELVHFLDTPGITIDPLVQLAAVVSATYWTHKDGMDEKEKTKLAVRAQAIHYVDFRDINLTAVKKLVDQAPYKGNTYAKAIILESAGTARIHMLALKTLVKSASKDEGYKQLLTTAPEKGVAAYEADAKKYATEIATSNKFEEAFYGPSKKARAGCYANLVKDFNTVVKPLKRGNPKELDFTLSQPVPRLLLGRIAACAADDVGKEYASKLAAKTQDFRYARGARIAGYYAVVEALGEILADRSKFPVAVNDLWFRPSDILYTDSFVDGGIGFFDEGAGTVKSLKKAGDGQTVTWVTSKRQVMTFNCTRTNRILRIDSSGNVIYDENCKEAGMVSQDTTPMGVTIPTAWSGGIAAGVVIDFFAGRGNDATRPGLPAYVYKDKSKKEIVNFYGLKIN